MQFPMQRASHSLIAPSHLWHDEDIRKQDGRVQVVSADGLHSHLRNIVRALNVNVGVRLPDAGNRATSI